MVRLEVDGAAELERSLTAASRAVGRLQAPNGQAAQQLAEAAAQRAPRRSGRLAGSIRPYNVTDRGADIGTSVVYSAVQEYGWAAHNIRGRHYMAGAAKSTDVTPVYNKFMDNTAQTIRGI